MIDAVFISDLHLNPAEPAISETFFKFIDWAGQSCRRLYILGDFFHVWVGDDELCEWSLSHAEAVNRLVSQGIEVFFMAGNRDFLLGERFAKLAGWEVLAEPSIIQCGQTSVLLAHGDGYCMSDKGHQRLRWLTRNRWFPSLFLLLPLSWRQKMAAKLRAHSQKNRYQQKTFHDVEAGVFLKELKNRGLHTLIHGHTHRPGLYKHQEYQRYVLSDWDDKPSILCYDDTKGFYFTQI